MKPAGGRFLRDNAFLVAAATLPLLVVGFFLVATAVPRWLVPPPAHDLVLRATGSYQSSGPRILVDFQARDGRIQVTLRPAGPNEYVAPWALFLFEHETMNVRRIPVELPLDIPSPDRPLTIFVDAFAGRVAFAQTVAPDGYRFETSTYRSSGLLGGLFGMDRYQPRVSIVKSGRVIPIALPAPYDESPAVAVSWLE